MITLHDFYELAEIVIYYDSNKTYELCGLISLCGKIF
jgi:hypothetical protein